MNFSSFVESGELTDVVWVQTSFLGDLILTTGAFRLLGDIRPALRQHLVTNAVGRNALAGHPNLSSIVEFKKRDVSFLAAAAEVQAALRQRGIERNNALTLQPHLSYRSSLLAMKLGLRRVTYQEAHLNVFARKVDRVAVLHECQRIALLLEPLGFSREQCLTAHPFLPVKQHSSLGEAADLLAKWALGCSVVGIAPGSVWGTKRWPDSSFRGLVKRLLKVKNVRIVMLGSEAERPLVRTIIGPDHDHERIMDLAGRTSLEDLRFVFPKLTVLLSNDSSPIHYASAFNVPTVAVFGATTPALGFGPLAPRSITLGVDLDCRPCSDHGPKVCPLQHFSCMKSLEVDQVWDALQQRIS